MQDRVEIFTIAYFSLPNQHSYINFSNDFLQVLNSSRERQYEQLVLVAITYVLTITFGHYLVIALSRQFNASLEKN